MRMRIQWINQGKTKMLANGVLQLQLPLHVTLKPSDARVDKPRLASVGTIKHPSHDSGQRILTWRDIALHPEGAVTFTVEMSTSRSGQDLALVSLSPPARLAPTSGWRASKRKTKGYMPSNCLAWLGLG